MTILIHLCLERMWPNLQMISKYLNTRRSISHLLYRNNINWTTDTIGHDLNSSQISTSSTNGYYKFHLLHYWPPFSVFYQIES